MDDVHAIWDDISGVADDFEESGKELHRQAGGDASGLGGVIASAITVIAYAITASRTPSSG
jgi:hypothetical protein